MNTYITCPHCQKPMRIPAAGIGKAFSCPLCKGTFIAESPPLAEPVGVLIAPSPAERVPSSAPGVPSSAPSVQGAGGIFSVRRVGLLLAALLAAVVCVGIVLVVIRIMGNGTQEPQARQKVGGPADKNVGDAADGDAADKKPQEKPQLAKEKHLIPEANWEKVDNPLGGFRVLMPDAPTASEQALPGRNAMTIHRFLDMDLRHLDIAFSASFFDVPAEEIKLLSLEKRFAAARQDIRVESAGAVKWEKHISLDGHPGREWESQLPNNRKVLGRLFAVRDRGMYRFYRLTVVGRKVTATSPDVRKFLDSFALLEPPPAIIGQMEGRFFLKPEPMEFGRVISLTYSKDGTTLIAGYADGLVRTWETSPPTPKLRATRTLHTPSGWISSFALSPDGELVAAGIEAGQVFLCDAKTGQLKKAIKHRDGLEINTGCPVTFSPDGKRLASAHDYVRLWSVADQQLLGTFEVHPQFLGGFGYGGLIWIHPWKFDRTPPRAVAFSADGKWLAAGGAEHTIKLWNLENGSEPFLLVGQERDAAPDAPEENSVFTLAFSPDGKTLASGGTDARVRLWDLEKRKPRASLKHKGLISALAFSQDGTRLAASSVNGSVYVLDAEGGRKSASLWQGGGDGLIGALAFSPDGKVLAIGARDVIKLWPVHNLTLVDPEAVADAKIVADAQGCSVLQADNSPVRFVGFAKDPKDPKKDAKTLIVVCANGQIRTWGVSPPLLQDSSRLQGSDHLLDFDVSPDGRTGLAMSSEGKVSLFDMATGEAKVTLQAADKRFTLAVEFILRRICWAGDGRHVAIVLGEGLVGGRPQRCRVHVWDIAEQKLKHALTDFTDHVHAVEFSPDSKILATAVSDNTVRLWDVATAKEVATLRGTRLGTQAGSDPALAFSSDGKMLASGGFAGGAASAVRIWDLQTRKQRILVRPESLVWQLAFSKNSKMLAGSSGSAISLWDVETGTSLGSLTPSREEFRFQSVSFVAFSPGDMFLAAAADRAVQLWDMHKVKRQHPELSQWGAAAAKAKPAKAKPLEGRTILAHRESIYDVAFSPDSKQVATAGYADHVKWWGVSAGRLLETMPAQLVRLSKAGKHMLVWHDGAFRVRDVATGKVHAGVIEARDTPVGPSALSPDDTRALVLDGGRLKMFRLPACQLEAEWPDFQPIQHLASASQIAFAADGKTFAIAGGSADKPLRIYDVAKRKELVRCDAAKPDLKIVTFTPDGKRLLAAGEPGGILRIWDAANGRLLATLSTEQGTLASLAVHRAGRILATAGEEGTVFLWDLTTNQRLVKLQIPGGPATSPIVAFSPDGLLLAAAGRGTLTFWDLEQVLPGLEDPANK